MRGKLTDGGDGGDDLAKLELVQDRRLTRGIETNLVDERKRNGVSAITRA